jgi:superfamily II DNA or RNA helicase
MIFTKTKKHVDNVAALCAHNGIDYDTLYGSKNKFDDKNVLIFSISKTGTGFDLPTVLGEAFSGVKPDALILMTTIKEAGLMKQVLGRVLRHDKPSFIYLIDSNKTCKSHYRENEEVFLESNGDITQIYYDPTVLGGGVKLDSL